MHNFDEQRALRYEEDRTFQIGGEKFTHRPVVRPERMAAYEDMETTKTAAEAIEILDSLIVAWIDPTDDPTAHERWRALREREDDPIGGSDLSDLVRWLYQQSTRRPTQPLSPSTDGAEPTGTPLREISSTEPAAPSAA